MPFDGVELSETTERLVIGYARVEAGWCRNYLYRDRYVWGQREASIDYCLLGAVSGQERPERGRTMIPGRVHDLIVAAIVDLGYGPQSPNEFNDSADRKKAQVLDVLARAIAMSRGASVPFWRRAA